MDPRRLRILTLTAWYPPHHRGGYELACHDVVMRLRQRGHHVSVLCSDTIRSTPDQPTAGPEQDIRRRLRLYFEDDEPTRPSLRTRLEIERHNQAVLTEILDEERPEVVFVWHMGALSLGLLTTLIERQIPLVYSICDDWLVYGTTLDPWADMFNDGVLRRALGRLARPLVRVPTTLPDIGSSGIFCFISDATRQGAHAGTRWTFPDSTVVFSGIDEALFELHDATAGDGPDWRWQLFYSGRFDPRKGVETLLSAVAQVPEARLVLDGRPTVEEQRWVDALIAALGLSERVAVQSSARSELPNLYASADVVVFPSEWDEPFGLVPVEAMACGTPVVATGTGGSGEYLRDGVNCLLYRAGDPAQLVVALQRLAADAGLRGQLVAGGLRTAQTLTAASLTDACEESLFAAIDEDRRVPADRTLPGPGTGQRPAAAGHKQ